MATPPLIPPAPERIDRSFVDRFAEAIRRGFSQTINENEATQQLLLLSPGGKVYAVKVSDAGVLSTTYISG